MDLIKADEEIKSPVMKFQTLKQMDSTNEKFPALQYSKISSEHKENEQTKKKLKKKIYSGSNSLSSKKIMSTTSIESIGDKQKNRNLINLSRSESQSKTSSVR